MKHLVIDTGYLHHLLQVDGYSDPISCAKVRGMFEKEAKAGSVFYVSVPVVYELCNAISRVPDGGRRLQLATSVLDAISSSLENQSPWFIIPLEGDNSMVEWRASLELALGEFRWDFASQGIGLTDLTVLRHARDIARSNGTRPEPRPCVHIWTVDVALKCHEPDPEDRPFVGGV